MTGAHQSFANQLIGFFVVVGLIFSVLVLPRSGWDFVGDDFGAVYAGKRANKSGVSQFWRSYPNDDIIYPSNVKRSHSFLSVFFRPLLLMLYGLEYKMFGHQSGWPYFVLSIFLHALAAGCLFFLLARFFSLPSAIVLSLCFGLFPLMGRFIGRISVQSYSLCMIVAVLCIFGLQSFLSKPRRWIAFASSLALLLSLLMHEILLTLPLVLALPTLFGNFERKQVVRCIEFSAWMLAACTVYMAMKVIAYPLNMSDNVLLSAGLGLRERFFHLLTVLTDTLGMTSLPEGNGKIKLCVLGLFAVIFLGGFLASKRRNVFLGLGFGFLLACWPALMFCHGHRYLYFSTPIFLVALAFCVQDLARYFKNWIPQKAELVLPGLLTLAGVFECTKSFSAFQARSQVCHKAFQDVGKTLGQTGRPICFVGMPMELISLWGAAQGVWLHSELESPVFYDGRLNAQSTFNNTVYSKVPAQNLLSVEASQNSVSVKSSDSGQIWLQMMVGSSGPELCDGIGQTIDFSCRSDGMLEKISINLDPKLKGQNPAFVSWDYENEKVMFLNESDSEATHG